MKALVTTLGRAHFVQVASALHAFGVSVTLFQGWLVRNPERSFLLRVASWMVEGNALVYGFKKRLLPDSGVENIGDFWAEFLQKILTFTIGRIGWRTNSFCQKVGFYVHGMRAKWLIKHDRYDVFHVKSGLGAGGAIAYAKKMGVKVLVDHSAGAPKFITETVDKKKWNRWTFWHSVQRDCDQADLLMVDCDWVKETFLMYGYPAGKIRVVYMGLDLKFNGLKKWTENLKGVGMTMDNPLRIVFTGPFMEHKGNEAFLAAIELLMSDGVQMTVDVIGSYSISDDQKSRYPHALALLKFHGHVTQDEMCKRMIASHIYLFPSLSEGCAKSAYEALSMGLCVVCTKETGLPIHDGEQGWLVEKGNPFSIRDRIKFLMANPEQMSDTGKAGVILMRQFTWDAYARNVAALYEELKCSGEKAD